jgi:DNA excision repair protein ERCC-3
MPPRKRKSDVEADEEYRPNNATGGGRKSTASKRAKDKDLDTLPIFPQENETFRDYSNELQLKPDHEQRPIWVTKDNLIFLEAFNPLYQQACDFLVTIAEPEARPEYIHTYRLTQNSLYAAVAVSINTETIIKILNRLCKTNVPSEVISFIEQSTYTFGKAKIVLKDNHFYIESQFPDILKELLKNPNIRNAREIIDNNDFFLESNAPTEDIRSSLDYQKLAIDTIENEEDEEQDGGNGNGNNGSMNEDGTLINQSTMRKDFKTVSFMIKRNEVQAVKRYAKEESHYPLMEEYDFKNDLRNPNLPFDLRASTKIRVSRSRSSTSAFYSLLNSYLYNKLYYSLIKKNR